MKRITIIAILSPISGCVVEQKNMVDIDSLIEEITVTHRILIPGTGQYCEIDDGSHKILSCEQIQVYSETEE